MPFRICQKCGQSYNCKEKDHSSKYCNKCSIIVTQDKKIKVPKTKNIVCEKCGKIFTVKFKNNLTHKCSDCLFEETHHPCIVCGKLTSLVHRYCSRKCYYEDEQFWKNRENWVLSDEGKQYLEIKKQKTFEKNHHPCPVCGKPALNINNTCSRDCMMKLGEQGKNISKALFKVHSDLERHNDIIRKTQETNVKLWGFKTFAESQYYKEISVNSSRKKYGVDHHTQRAYSAELLQILSNKDSAKQFVEEHNIKYLTDILAYFPKNDYIHIARKLNDFGIELKHKFGAEEQKFKNYIESILNVKFKKNRKALCIGELDLYNDDIKIVFEFNGSYWHSDVFKDEKYHMNKTLECLNKNIKLFHIYESEWLNEKHNEILKSIILSTKNTKILTKYNVRNISSEISKDFFIKNNLYETNILCENNLALVDESDNILRVIAYRLKNNTECEIIYNVPKLFQEYCNTADILLHYLKENLKMTSIEVNVDINKFSGNTYYKNNFRLNKYGDALLVTDLYSDINEINKIYACPFANLIWSLKYED